MFKTKAILGALSLDMIAENLKANTIFGQRPEQLSVEAFIQLTKDIEQDQ